LDQVRLSHRLSADAERADVEIGEIENGVPLPSAMQFFDLNGDKCIPGGPMVRIRFPPAVSQVRTCLAREFAFLGREATNARWAWNRASSPAAPLHGRAAGIAPERGLFCLAVRKTRGRQVDGVANRGRNE
jgi:hypothetical protein